MSTYLSLARFVVAAVTLGVVTTASHAALTTYTGQQIVNITADPFTAPTSGAAISARGNFIDDVSVIAEEGFERESPEVLNLANLLGNRASLSGGGSVETLMCDSGYCPGRFNTTPNGTTWYESSSSFTIDFGNLAVSAFGFYLTDFGDFGGTLSLFHNDTKIVDIPALDPASTGSLAFFGFTTYDLGYTSITFKIEQTGSNSDWIGIDDLVIGSLRTRNVPEPATLMLTGLGLLGLAATRRKQRH